MRADQGLGYIRHTNALPTLKRVILEDSDGLREVAYDSVLMILGKDDYNIPEEGLDRPTVSTGN